MISDFLLLCAGPIVGVLLGFAVAIPARLAQRRAERRLKIFRSTASARIRALKSALEATIRAYGELRAEVKEIIR